MVPVAIGGVIGSLFRYVLNELFGSDKNGVLIANQIGVAVAGFVVIYLAKHQNEKLRLFLIPGFCGGLTTFSSVMLLSSEFGYSYILENIFISFLVISFMVPLAKSKS